MTCETQDVLELYHLSRAQQKHSNSQTCITLFVPFKSFGKQQNVDRLLDAERRNDATKHDKQAKKNRGILRRCIAAVCPLAEKNFNSGAMMGRPHL